jgi:hypothetical protein
LNKSTVYLAITAQLFLIQRIYLLYFKSTIVGRLVNGYGFEAVRIRVKRIAKSKKMLIHIFLLQLNRIFFFKLNLFTLN